MAPLTRRVGSLFVGIAFWFSILLGLAYPLLLVGIAASLVPPATLMVVLTAHACTLVAGHRHRRSLGTG